MAGELTPVVLFSRFTTVAGAGASAGELVFATVAMDVTPFQSGLINIWRGKVLGTSATMKMNLEESSDGVKWTTCGGTSLNFEPAENVETQYAPILKKKWFRMTVELGNPNNTLTLWAAGFLESRES